MFTRILLTAQLMLVGVALAAAQQTYYVDGTSGDDAWNGLCQTWDGGTCGPKATIQAALDLVSDNDTVVIADGVYVGQGSLSFWGSDVTIRSANGPGTCVIDCGGQGRAFALESYMRLSQNL